MSSIVSEESGCDIVRILRARAEHQPSRLAFSFLDDRSLSGSEVCYAQLDMQARRIAAELLALGMSGERAVLLFQPGAEYVFALLGCWYAKVVAVPVFAPRMNASLGRVRAIVANADARMVLSTRQIIDSLQEAEWQPWCRDGLRMIATDAISSDMAQQWAMPDFDADTLAVLQYTSGSTGVPKGVRLQHRHLMTNSRMIARNMHTSADSIGVTWIPPYHDMGLIGGVLQPLYQGFPGYLMLPASFLQRPMRWLEAISQFRGTHTAAPNFAYDLCVKRARPEHIAALELSCLRVMGNGAEPVRADTLRRFAEKFAATGFDARAFFPCYGMAETTLYVSGPVVMQGVTTLKVARASLAAGTVVACDNGDVELVSCGVADQQATVAIVDPLDGLPCAEGEVGEIWVAGATVADGYWQRADATAETFQARLPGSSENWLRTGDLGARVAGEIYVTGRIKDMIVIRGHNHYPQDIESTVQQSHDSVRQNGVAAFAIDTDDGEGLGLVVELERSGLMSDVGEVEAAVRHAVSQEHQLAPARIAFVKANRIPRTSSGKIQRFMARDMLCDGRLAPLDAEPVSAQEA